jgi:hypothetical protein
MPWALAQAERALGIESSVLYSQSSWMDYPANTTLRLEQVHGKLARFTKLFRTFLQIRDNYEVFHFNFGQSLLSLQRFGIYEAEVPFYPKDKKLFVTYNGCDARQKYPTIERTTVSACHRSRCYSGICNSGTMDKIKQKRIGKMAQYVGHMWAVNPDLLHFLPKDKSSFLPYLVNVEITPPKKMDFDKKKLRVIHAPTNRAAKGSDSIIATMEELKGMQDAEVEFQVMEELPHKQAIKNLSQADLVIDQILIGWYGGFAVEAMSMGKPVICRIAEEDLHFIPRSMAADVKEAFINTNQENLKDMILRCIEDRDFLKRKSEAALEYARTWHNPKYVASITKEAYESL